MPTIGQSYKKNQTNKRNAMKIIIFPAISPIGIGLSIMGIVLKAMWMDVFSGVFLLPEGRQEDMAD